MTNGQTPTTPQGQLPLRAAKQTALVVRSDVPVGLPYGDYRPYLRPDFFYSCAYCTISEAEAKGIRFTIDHYEPQVAAPELINDYSNLMYSCDTCNNRKGERNPPASARLHGHRFFRSDQDLRADHFQLNEIWLSSKTPVGAFTIEFIDLNRAALRRLRGLRQRLVECDTYVVEGIFALRSFPIDTLPIDVRTEAIRKIKEAMGAAEDIANAIDDLLREYGKSALLDPDPDAAERARVRAAQQKELKALFPGNWRVPRVRRATKKKRK